MTTANAALRHAPRSTARARCRLTRSASSRCSTFRPITGRSCRPGGDGPELPKWPGFMAPALPLFAGTLLSGVESEPGSARRADPMTEIPIAMSRGPELRGESPSTCRAIRSRTATSPSAGRKGLGRSALPASTDQHAGDEGGLVPRPHISNWHRGRSRITMTTPRDHGRSKTVSRSAPTCRRSLPRQKNAGVIARRLYAELVAHCSTTVANYSATRPQSTVPSPVGAHVRQREAFDNIRRRSKTTTSSARP